MTRQPGELKFEKVREEDMDEEMKAYRLAVAHIVSGLDIVFGGKNFHHVSSALASYLPYLFSQAPCGHRIELREILNAHLRRVEMVDLGEGITYTEFWKRAAKWMEDTGEET